MQASLDQSINLSLSSHTIGNAVDPPPGTANNKILRKKKPSKQKCSLDKVFVGRGRGGGGGGGTCVYPLMVVTDSLPDGGH